MRSYEELEDIISQSDRVGSRLGCICDHKLPDHRSRLHLRSHGTTRTLRPKRRMTKSQTKSPGSAVAPRSPQAGRHEDARAGHPAQRAAGGEWK